VSNSLKILFRQALLTHFSQQHIISDGLQIYRKLQQDDQDSVRLLTLEDLIVIAKRLSGTEVKEQLLRQIKQSIGDKSWRVRYMAANHFNEVCVQGVEELSCSNISSAF
jgi:serine/threonine-protein phosphatase 2A regulatory subunit A